MARWDTKSKNLLYQVYVTDALQVIAGNTARIAGGKSMSKRYAELLEPKAKKRKDTRTGDQIAADIVGKLFGKEAG